METKSKKKIWKIIISVLIIGVIIFATIVITQRAIRSKCVVELCESELENMISFLTNEDEGEEFFIYMNTYGGGASYLLNIDYVRCFVRWGSPGNDAEDFPFFLSADDKEFIKAYHEFIDNYPDLSDIYESYENNEIDILKAKELCFYEIQEALAENGLDDFSYIYRYSDKFGDFGD